MSQFRDPADQFEQLKDISPDNFTLPSELPEPVEMPPQQQPGLPGGGLPDFFEIDRQARQIRQQEQDPESLLEAIRELPERIAEALRIG